MDEEVFVATRNLEVFDILEQRDIPCQAGLYTDELGDALPTIRLVIIDDHDVVALKYSVSAIYGMLSQQGVLHCSSTQFLDDPDEFLRVLERQGKSGSPIPPKRTIAFVSYSGGTGKTTLAYDTALQFAQATERNIPRPVLLIEFAHGTSALGAMTGLQMPTLFELVTEPEEIEPAHHRGVTLIPMDYETARDLSAEMIENYLERQSADHTLTVIDSQWPHGLMSQGLRKKVEHWFVVTTPRVDAVANAEKLHTELGERAHVLLNQKGGLVDGLALADLDTTLELPRVPRPDAFEGKRLGEQVLRWLYGKDAWVKRYSQPKRWWEKLFGG